MVSLPASTAVGRPAPRLPPRGFVHEEAAAGVSPWSVSSGSPFGDGHAELRHAVQSSGDDRSFGLLRGQTPPAEPIALLNQSFRASGLNLVIAAIVYWNTVYIGPRKELFRATR
jgi:hypothetical protein